MTLNTCPHCGQPVLPNSMLGLSLDERLMVAKRAPLPEVSKLPKYEFILARTLIAAGENGATHDELFEALWPGQFKRGIKLEVRLRVHVSRLRDKLEPLGVTIHTRRRDGLYRLAPYEVAQ